MRTGDDRTLETAAQLLAKARSTDSAEEAAALAERCYRLLADYINTYEAQRAAAGEPRKRERRLLWDRRSGKRPTFGTVVPGTNTALRYRQLADSLDHGDRSNLDLKA